MYRCLSTATLQDNHIIIIIFEGCDAVLQVEEGDGSEEGGDAAGAGGALGVAGVYQVLHHSVLGGAQMGGQRVETLAAALVRLWTRFREVHQALK